MGRNLRTARSSQPPPVFPRLPHTTSLPAHHTAHIGIRAPAPCPTCAAPAPQHFPRPRTASRTLESALPRPVQLAHPLRRNTSRALRAYLHAAAPRNFPIRASMFARRFRANARASPAPHIHSLPHALAPLPRASRRRIVSNTQLMMQRKERRCAASVFIALCF